MFKRPKDMFKRLKKMLDKLNWSLNIITLLYHPNIPETNRPAAIVIPRSKARRNLLEHNRVLVAFIYDLVLLYSLARGTATGNRSLLNCMFGTVIGRYLLIVKL